MEISENEQIFRTEVYDFATAFDIGVETSKLFEGDNPYVLLIWMTRLEKNKFPGWLNDGVRKYYDKHSYFLSNR